jgi:limonene-1,2-epoxide hydrolase
MPAPIETVTAFLAVWDAPGGLARAIRDFFTPQTVWENVGMSKTTGPEEAMGILSGFGQSPETLVMRVKTLAIATTGGKVLTERIDDVVGPDGGTLMSFPVMGIFEVADGKITAWRDYFDTASLAPK